MMNFSFNTPTPCKGCEKRYVGCHGECQDYKEFRRLMDKQTDDFREKRKTRDDYYAVRTKGIDRKRLSGRSER